RHCQHPSGCDVPAEDCHIDHITENRHGGPTTQTNGRCYCKNHNLARNNHPNHQPHNEPDQQSPPHDDTS
ncbi:MAG: hypothetical protein QOD92_34, partial [Acidimicrobiaceae bacterium]